MNREIPLNKRHLLNKLPEPVPIKEYISRIGAYAFALAIYNIAVLMRTYRSFNNPASHISGTIYEATAENNTLINSAVSVSNSLRSAFPNPAAALSAQKASIKANDFKNYATCLYNMAYVLGTFLMPSSNLRLAEIYASLPTGTAAYDPPYQKEGSVNVHGWNLLYRCLNSIQSAWAVEECKYNGPNSWGEYTAASNDYYQAMRSMGASQEDVIGYIYE